MKLSPYWIRLRSGKKFDFINPLPSQICIKDIVHSLSLINRFNGHTKIPYTVLNHLIICHDLAPDDVKKECLGHDFSEALASDIASPLKALLPDYKKIENRIEKVIAEKYNLNFPYPKMVKQIDMTALKWEIRDLMYKEDCDFIPYDIPQKKLIPLDRETCIKEFLNRFYKLYRK